MVMRRAWSSDKCGSRLHVQRLPPERDNVLPNVLMTYECPSSWQLLADALAYTFLDHGGWRLMPSGDKLVDLVGEGRA